MLGDEGTFTIQDGPDGKEIAELTIIEPELTDEEIMSLAGTLTAIARMMLIELGIMEEDELAEKYKLETKKKLH